METYDHDKEYGFGLIMNHLTGAPSGDDLDEWRKASDENEQLFVQMQKIWNALSLSDRNEMFDGQRAYHLFRERIEAENRMAERIPLNPYRLLRRVASYAAVVIPFVILTTYLAYRHFAPEPAPEAMPYSTEVTVPYGSKTQLSLQDGTKIWLNAGSHLQYNSQFGQTNRSLTLSGEAYFEVAKNENLPFIVDAEGLKIKVLGTHFNVNAYGKNKAVEVTLLEGAVEMIAGKEKTVLQPGDKAQYNTATRKVSVQTGFEPQSAAPASNSIAADSQTAAAAASTATGEVLAWIDNRLVFNGETFEQIIWTLERNYNVKVNIHDEQIKKRRFAGDFKNNETIEQIFNVMSVNGKFRYKIKGNIIDVY